MRNSRPEETSSQASPGTGEFPPLRVPRDLVNACIDGDCVLYAGNGLSAQAGLPTWRTLLSMMVEWAIQETLVDDRVSNSLRAGLEQEEIESVSEGLLHQIGDHLPRLQEFLRKTLLNGVAPSPLHTTLSQIKFSAVLTTSFDELLEQSFQREPLSVYTVSDTEPLLAALSNRSFFILKLRGRLESKETIIFSTAQYNEQIANNRSFSTFMETLFFSRTIFFVGARLESIEEYVKGIKFSSTRQRRHFAVVDVSVTGPAWELKADSFSRRYGIEVLPYIPTQTHVEVQQFVDRLLGRINAKTRARLHRPPPDVSAPIKGAVKRLKLMNIGPFDDLELNLDPGWNILLGDNGVGKSTILKALVVAICGRDAQAYANRLIKVGKDAGTIILETDRGIAYKTEIVRGSIEAELTSTPGRPLEAEGWLAIGFPSTRIFTWARPNAPEARVDRRPTPEDLLPLIQGVSDPRIDKVKNWLVNVDYWIKDAREKNEDSQHYERIREEFFSVVGKLASGTKVEYGGIIASTSAPYEVTVLTSDGPMPIEAISQGTAALLGWIGVLLGRLHEIPPDPLVSPMERYALVLIDELDAHMHPAWQQALIAHLKEFFPNIQFLATTHSPFLAVGRRASEIVRLSRDPVTGRARGEPVEHDTKKMGVANVLTSYLFGLESPMDFNLQNDLRRKRVLAVKAKLSSEERAELKELTARLEDVDASTMFRDPLYKLYVEEMTRREEELDKDMGKLSKEKEDEQRQLTREILDELIRKKEARDALHPSGQARKGD